MGRLLYGINASLDGFVSDPEGSFSWSEPTPDLHQAFNDLERPIGTHLYGRRLYEVLAVWETMDVEAMSPVEAEYAQIWKASEKVVFSRTLEDVSTPRTRLEREFVPGAVRTLKAELPHDLLVGGPELAAQALRAGLVDEIQLYVWPVILGGGNPALPADLRVDLDLLGERRFANGVVQLRYGVVA